jgi:hypothetical protein
MADCMEAFRRYIPKSEKDALLASLAGEDVPPTKHGTILPAIVSTQKPESAAAA